MANEVTIHVTANAKGVRSVFKAAESDAKKSGAAAGKAWSGALSGVAAGAGALGALGAGVNIIGGAVGAVTALSGAALLVPGAALAGAAAMKTFELATSGFGEAVGAGLTGDVEAFNKATKDMAPEMRGAVQEVVAFKPALDGLKKAVQSNFWGQFSGDLTKLGNTYLPVMQMGLTGVSAKLGAMAKGAIATMNTPFFSGRVASILDDTTGMLDGMSSSVGDVLGGLVSVGAIGASYLPQLGEWVGGVTDRFREWTDSLEGQNQIKTWIDNGIQAFSDLFGIIGNVGSTVSSVFSGMGTSIESPLGAIREITAKIAEFAASAQGQEIFAAIGAAAQAAGAILGSAFMAALTAVLGTLYVLAPVITTVANVLAAWAPVLGPAVVAGYAFAQAISAVSAVMGAYNAAMAFAKAGTVATVATTVAGWITMGATALVQAAVMAASWLVAFWPIALVGALVVGLVALVVANWDTVKSWTISAWSAVSGAVSSAWAAITEAVNAGVARAKGILQWFAGLGGMFTGWFNAAALAVGNQILRMIGFVASLPGRVLSIFSGFPSLLVNAGRSLIQGLWNGIAGMVGWITSKVSGVLTSIRNLFPFSPAKEGPFSGKGYTTYSGQALMQDFGAGMESATGDVRSAASGVLGGAQGALPSAGGGWAGGGGVTVTFAGNTSDALATVIMQLVRTGKIQLKAA